MPCANEKNGKEGGIERQREKGRVECIELERRSVRRTCFNTAERSGWKTERKRERRELEVFVFAVLAPSCTHAKMDGYSGEKV